MAIKRRINNKWTAKADQEWDMAGAARQDGDADDEKRHTEKAREYEELALEEEASRE